MSSKPVSLCRQPDFLKFWAGETVSLFGSQISLLALPLTAVLLLHATPTQMGFLGAAEFAPLLLVSLFAGVWLDCLPRRPVMIGADIGLGVLFGSIPLAYIVGILTLEYLYLIGFLSGVFSVFFAIAYQAYLPALVESTNIVEGNSKLETSQSLAEIGGPALGGLLVQTLTGPFAILVDATSFLVSALCLSLIGKAEPALLKVRQRQSVWRLIREGLGEVLTNPVLRSFALCNSTSNFFQQMIGTVYVLYVVQELKIEPSLLGIILALGSMGGLVGALLARSVTLWFGFGRTIVSAVLVSALSCWLIPLAGTLPIFSLPLLIGGRLIYGLVNPIYRVSQLSLRQIVTSDQLQGRVNASMRFLSGGVLPLGALLSGFMGSTLGIRTTLFIGAGGMSLSFVWVFFSPVRKLHKPPVRNG